MSYRNPADNPHLADGDITIYPNAARAVPSPATALGKFIVVYLETLRHTGTGLCLLRCAPSGSGGKGQFWAYGHDSGLVPSPPHWREVSNSAVLERLSEWAGLATTSVPSASTGIATPKPVSQSLMHSPNVTSALRAATMCADMTAPKLFEPAPGLSAGPFAAADMEHLLTTWGGIIDMREPTPMLNMRPHTPLWFPMNYAFHLKYVAPKAMTRESHPDSALWLDHLVRSFTNPDDVGNTECRDAVELLAAFMGNALSGRSEQGHHFLWAYGKSGTGKSIVATVIRSMFASTAAVALGAESMATQFWAGRLPGKRLITMPDVPVEWKGSQNMLANIKVMTGGEVFLSMKKGADGVDVKLNAVMVVTANGLPNFEDTVSALARRILPLAMNNVVGAADDPAFATKLARPDALSSMLNFALMGYRMLYGYGEYAAGGTRAAQCWNGKMKRSAAANTAIDRLSADSSPVTQFIEECLIVDPPDLRRLQAAQRKEGVAVPAFDGRQIQEKQITQGGKDVTLVYTVEAVFSDIYTAYELWAHSAGITGTSKIQSSTLSRRLRLLLPGFTVHQIKTRGTNHLDVRGLITTRVAYGLGLAHKPTAIAAPAPADGVGVTATGAVLTVVTQQEN